MHTATVFTVNCVHVLIINYLCEEYDTIDLDSDSRRGLRTKFSEAGNV